MSKPALLVLALLLVAAGCGRIEQQALRPLEGKTVRVVATVGMVGDAAVRIGGSRVSVETLMGPGIDPHVYKASEGDLRRLERADVILYAGLHLEAKMADVFERIGDGRATRGVAEAIPVRLRLAPAAFGGAYDPHVWFDVGLWRHAVEAVRDTLAARDPGSAAHYRRNAAAYLRELDELDTYVREQARRVPRERRVLVTAHDAFGYFGRAYGFEVRGLQGISTASEAGAGDVQALARFIADRRIPAIFVESSVSPRTIEAVREAVRARGFEVRLGRELLSDALGATGTPEGTYVGMVRHNIDAIVEGLRG